jgi:hypothetical protein
MKTNKRSMTLLTAAILVCATLFTAIPAFAQPPPFSATITITGDTELTLGESTTLTANWETNRDVTREEWAIDGTSQGIVIIPGASSGSSTFTFLPTTTGTFTISYRIWHHVQTDRDASNSVTITVTDDPIEYEWETAFAYCGQHANAFPEYGFSRWGWTIGPLNAGSYTLDLYAGAAQCDLTKGTLVGTVSVVYDGTSVTVNFNVNTPYILGETHVYAGQGMFPLKNGEPTVAPGQYYIDTLSGPIYVIAHAEVGIPM